MIQPPHYFSQSRATEFLAIDKTGRHGPSKSPPKHKNPEIEGAILLGEETCEKNAILISWRY